MGSTVFPAPASGPTLAEITTVVQANAGYGNTYTLLATQASTNQISTDISWSGTYKKIVVIGHGIQFSGVAVARLSLNADVTINNYSGATEVNQGGTTYTYGVYPYYQVNGAIEFGQNYNTGNQHAFTITIDAANKTSPKVITGIGYSGYNGNPQRFNGTYVGGSAITSVRFWTSNAQTWSGGTVYIYGVN